jgi:phage terminase small subunit
MDNLPILTQKQQTFLLQYLLNGNATESYRAAFDCSNMKDKTVWEEASKMLNHPKVAPWIEYHQKNQQEVIKEELNYTALDAFKEFQEMQELAKQSSKNYGNAIKCIENKAKLAGLFKERLELSGGTVVQMGEVKVADVQLSFEVGAELDDTSKNS